MTYKGYQGSAQYSDDDQIFYGNMIGIKAQVSYERSSVDELRAAFEEAVEDYLENCESPEKPKQFASL